MRGLRVLLILVPLLAAAPAQAQNRLDKAKQLFTDGRKAYEQGDYQRAYDAFKESYLLSHEPALLYNISSALQGLRRPHEAAEALRSFLRLRSDDPERPQIEERVRALEEEQRLLDAERARNAATVVVTPTVPETHISLTPLAADTAVVARHDADWERRKKKKIIGAVVGSILGAAVVGTAIGLAVGLSGSTEPYSAGSIGPLPGTR